MPTENPTDLKHLQKWKELSVFEESAREAGYSRVCGIDEAGRGPLAGPVVAAAVIFPAGCFIPGLDDSKKLSARQREFFYRQIVSTAVSIGIGIIEPAIIDEINILNATILAMETAVFNLSIPPDYLLIDAVKIPNPDIPKEALIHGDSRSYSIAGASVIAKVSRDRLMAGYHRQFPEYGFEKHKGYGTRDHLSAIRSKGASFIHRKSFRGVLSGAGA